MFRKLVSLLIALSFLLIGTAVFTVAAEQQQAPVPQTPTTTKPAPAVTQPIKLLPDLVVVSATVVQTAPTKFTLEIYVKNQGGSPAGPFTVRSLEVIELAEAPGQPIPSLSQPHSESFIAGLAPGSSYKIQRFLGTPEAGLNIKIKEVFVDSGNSVVESNEGNNKVTYR
jgi:hypothetical protein